MMEGLLIAGFCGVALTILYAGQKVERMIHLANLDRIDNHNQAAKAFDAFRLEMRSAVYGLTPRSTREPWEIPGQNRQNDAE